MAKLIFLGEKFAGRVYEFAIEKTTVGRGDHNTLTIHDASVSHSHGEILVYGTEVIVRDLGSSNGTIVDGKRLHKEQQQPLENGQIVKFGSVEARLELSAEPSSDTVTGWTAMHSHVRHLADKPKPATEVTARLEPSPPAAPDDHTLLLPRPSLTPTSPPSSGPASQTDTQKLPRSSAPFAIVVTVIVIGLVVLCWFLLGKRH